MHEDSGEIAVGILKKNAMRHLSLSSRNLRYSKVLTALGEVLTQAERWSSSNDESWSSLASPCILVLTVAKNFR